MNGTSATTKAIFYLRVSTDRQMDGAAAQFEMLRAAASSVGIMFPSPAKSYQRLLPPVAMKSAPSTSILESAAISIRPDPATRVF